MADVIDRETLPHRSRKDRARWCKGKPGREHVPGEIVPRFLPSNCRWVHFWPRGCGMSKPRYWCGCWQRCTACGRYLRKANRDECPNYTPERPEPRPHPNGRGRVTGDIWLM